MVAAVFFDAATGKLTLSTVSSEMISHDELELEDKLRTASQRDCPGFC